jgi:hypothetical protein
MKILEGPERNELPSRAKETTLFRVLFAFEDFATACCGCQEERKVTEK